MQPLSPGSAIVKRLRRLLRDRDAREESGRMVLEGHKLLLEALDSPVGVHRVLVQQNSSLSSELVTQLAARSVETLVASEAAIERISSTRNPQPTVAEVSLPRLGWEALELQVANPNPRHGLAVIAAVNLNDPGNLGTMMRSALGAGFDALVLLGDTVDPFGPKVVRASAGAALRLPLVRDRVGPGLERLELLGFERIGTRSSQGQACDQVDLIGHVALVLGSESHGVGIEGAQRVDRWVTIPMPGPVDSLNVAMATSILTYEVCRQRRR